MTMVFVQKQRGEKMDELIYRQAAIGVLNDGAELWRRVLDEPDVVGIERKKYEWGLGLIESYISDMKELPPAQTDRSLWFRIGEICVDESNGFINADSAVEKIRELLKEAERREDGR